MWNKKIITDFIVTVFGVFIAFWLTGLGEQFKMDKITKQKINLVGLEAEYNIIITREILIYCSEPNKPVFFRRLNSDATSGAFHDENILTYLPYYRVSLLRGYLEDISTLNQTLQVYQMGIENQFFKNSNVESKLRKAVCDNAASVCAKSIVLQKELNFDPNLYDRENINILKNKIELVKDKILKGETNLSK